MVPLQQDVSRLQRRLRMKPEAQVKELTLDLRQATTTASAAGCCTA